LICIAGSTRSFAATLEWNPNPEPEIAGYKVYIGTQSRNYDRCIDVGLATSHVLCLLVPLQTYYFAVTAYAVDGAESDFSDEVTYVRSVDGTSAWFVPLRMVFSADAPVSLEFTNGVSCDYFVQGSTNLVNWETLNRFSGDTNVLKQWTDTNSSQYPSRFYRVIGGQQ